MSDLKKYLIRIQKKLRQFSRDKYNRVNPFVEDITDWKERENFYLEKTKM